MYCFFFFNDTATTEIYTLSLHDALPICHKALELDQTRDSVPDHVPVLSGDLSSRAAGRCCLRSLGDHVLRRARQRSEEHTSELQSRQYLVCRLLLEKKKKNQINTNRAIK